MKFSKKSSKHSKKDVRGRAAFKSMARSYIPRSDSLVSAPGVGIGATLKTVLKTVAYVNISTAADGTNRYSIFTGSINQPFGNLIAGVQPVYYDQYAALFQRYTVLDTTFKLSFSQFVVGGAAVPAVVAAFPTANNGISLTTIQGYASQPYGQSKMISQGSTTQSDNQLYFKINTRKLIGAAISPVDNGALMGASPANGENQNVALMIQATSAAVTTGSVLATIYQTVLFDRRTAVVDA